MVGHAVYYLEMTGPIPAFVPHLIEPGELPVYVLGIVALAHPELAALPPQLDVCASIPYCCDDGLVAGFLRVSVEHIPIGLDCIVLM